MQITHACISAVYAYIKAFQLVKYFILCSINLWNSMELYETAEDKVGYAAALNSLGFNIKYGDSPN